jgi:hypothetical protein
MQNIEQEYKDWLELLKQTNNEDLLNDPYNVWLEAWTIATLLAKKDLP